ncbi:putative redox protein [Colwellia chukchiensis]|uniref:Putative redox protein n=1 Tax=Colwellia chukchiensis TaxID=641665 RepID=A0A1H7SCJ0_9GAMM|nr:OsmC family protein [Colwellia chukchiensis]SEL70088.1 putative redox protein [Colwellia chukchiensis]
MKAEVKWIGDELFMATSESGHSLVLDANAGALAPSPLENVLLSLGGCSSVDVVSILQKARQNISGCKVEIAAKRLDTVPRLFSDIHLHFVIQGRDVNAKHVERAVSLSADKYCSVALMLNKAVNISHDFQIINDEK